MNRLLINENISPIVFHFCPLSVMYQISVKDAFKLAETGKYESDTRMNSFPTGIKDEHGGMIRKTYPYYMCFSRTPSTMVGYQLMRITSTKNDWVNSLVRMEIDGNALNAKYKGAPVNFFTEKNPTGDLAKKYKYAQDWDNFVAIPSPKSDKMGDRIAFGKGNLIRKELPKINPDVSKRGRPSLLPNGQKEVKVDYKSLERNRMSEFEDRIYSYKEYILHASKYIKRIDILVSNKSLKSRDVIVMISKIIQKYGQDKVFVYNSQIAFNSMNIRNAISKNNLDKIYYSNISSDEFSDYESEVNFKFSQSDLYNVSGIISMMAFVPNFTNEQYDKNIYDICRILGLTHFNYYDEVINYYDEIRSKCYNFLGKFNDSNIGYAAGFPVYSMYIRNFEKRNQGKNNIMEIFSKLISLANSNAQMFSNKFYNGSRLSVPLATKLKYIMFLKNNN